MSDDAILTEQGSGMGEILNEQTVERLWPRDESDTDTATVEHLTMLCASHEALRARLAEVERERDALRVTTNSDAVDLATLYDLGALVTAQRDAAEARVRELTEALRKYGEHDYECDYLMLDEGECDCGFDAVLAVLGEQEAVESGQREIDRIRSTPEARVRELTEALRRARYYIVTNSSVRFDVVEDDLAAVDAVLGEQEAASPGNPDPQFMVDGYDMTPPVAASPGEPERCPTCGSDDPGVCTKGYAHRIVNPGMCCSDPWHGEQKGDEG